MSSADDVGASPESILEIRKANREVIRANIEQNQDVFECDPDSEEIIGLVMSEIQPEATAD